MTERSSSDRRRIARERGRATSYDIVIPTVGRPSLERLLRSLEAQPELAAGRIIVVDDRSGEVAREPLVVPPLKLRCPVEVLRSGGRGPAGARNRGVAASDAEWVAFLDDDTVAPAGWAAALARDLAACDHDVAGNQANITVPLPPENESRPTDWQRNVRGLEQAQWATADMAFRRSALDRVAGFDERFPRAFREDADLALRLLDAGYRLVRGSRTIVHPVAPASRWVSLRLQAGNADDPLMTALHGSDWRDRAGALPGRRPRHIATTAAGVLAVTGLLLGRRRLAALGALGWTAGTAELAWTRIEPGPRTRDEVTTMLATSALMPPVATAWWLRGMVRAWQLLGSAAPPREGSSSAFALAPDPDRAPAPAPAPVHSAAPTPALPGPAPVGTTTARTRTTTASTTTPAVSEEVR